jgi:hypothetical protein
VVDISCDSSTAYFGDSTSTGMEVEPFSIGSTGLLAPLPTFTNSSGNNSSNVLLSTDGNTLVVDNNSSLQITTLAVGTGGALTYEATTALNNPNVDQSSSTTLITNKGGGRVFMAEQGITGEPGALGLLKVKAGALKEVNGSPSATGDPNSPAVSIATYPGKVCQ